MAASAALAAGCLFWARGFAPSPFEEFAFFSAHTVRYFTCRSHPCVKCHSGLVTYHVYPPIAAASLAALPVIRYGSAQFPRSAEWVTFKEHAQPLLSSSRLGQREECQLPAQCGKPSGRPVARSARAAAARAAREIADWRRGAPPEDEAPRLIPPRSGVRQCLRPSVLEGGRLFAAARLVSGSAPAGCGWGKEKEGRLSLDNRPRDSFG